MVAGLCSFFYLRRCKMKFLGKSVEIKVSDKKNNLSEKILCIIVWYIIMNCRNFEFDGGNQEVFQSEKQKRISYILFSVYFILLIWLILFKFATNLSELPSMRGINLIPFSYNQGTNTHLREVLYNVIVFIPLGVYIQIFKEGWKKVTKCLVVFSTSFLFEVVQFIFAIGASDVTDLIGNTFGGIVGILFCIIMKKIAPKKFISIINVLGMLFEIAAIGLLLLLLTANR